MKLLLLIMYCYFNVSINTSKKKKKKRLASEVITLNSTEPAVITDQTHQSEIIAGK